MRGTVVAFDEHAGLGTIQSEDSLEFLFHCTRLVDGSRRIEVGVEVRFEVVAGHLGKWEAAGIETVAVRP